MNRNRSMHICINVKDEYLVAIGGFTDDTTEYYDANTWEMGPSLPYKLSGASAVIDRHQRILILGGFNWDKGEASSKVIMFDPERRIFKEIDKYGLREPLFDPISILQ